MILLITWIIFIALEALRNWYVIVRKNTWPNHTIGVMFRLSIALILYAICAPQSAIYVVIPAMFFLFWFVFDISLNLMRGRHLLYIGRNALIDRITRNYSLPVWFIKLVGAIVAVYVIIYGISV